MQEDLATQLALLCLTCGAQTIFCSSAFSTVEPTNYTVNKRVLPRCDFGRKCVGSFWLWYVSRLYIVRTMIRMMNMRMIFSSFRLGARAYFTLSSLVRESEGQREVVKLPQVRWTWMRSMLRWI